jgi:predicted ATPase
MGKTRLAVRYAWQHLPDWPGGVWFCDLTETRSVPAIASALAGTLGVQLGNNDPIDQLGNAIAGRGCCLIVLDNFEQVTSHAAETLGRWMEKAGEARFLITSREKLGLGELEKVQVVDSMSPETGLALLTVRARWLRPGLDLSGAEAESAREIVRLVDGMPLAIELAAARMRVMSATQIVQQMRSRFHLLTGGPSARHETLVVTIDGSWELLRPWEQAACAQCAVFEGGFTLEAAVAVLDLKEWSEAPWVVDVVQSLVDKSFLRTWVPAGAHGGMALEARFGMYVSLQDYARLKLRDGTTVKGAADGIDAERATEARHSKWFGRHGTDDMLASLDRHGGVRRLQQLGQDLENLKAACHRALAQGDLSTAAAGYRATWAVLGLRGPFEEAVEIGRQIVAHPGLELAERAKVLRTLAQAERHAGRTEARSHFEDAIAIHRRLGDRRREGTVLTSLGSVLFEQGLVVEAREHYETALVLARETADRHHEGNILNHLGTLCASQGRMEEAQAHLLSALAVHRELGNRRSEGVALTTLGEIHNDQGRRTEARSCLEAALAIHREVGNRRFECAALTSLGNLLVEQGEVQEAGAYFEQSLRIARELGSLRMEGMVLGDLGQLLHARGRFEEAIICLERALAIQRQTGYRQTEASTLCQLAELLLSQGRVAAASEALLNSEEICRSIDDTMGLGQALCLRAKIEHAAGNAQAARSALAEAEVMASQVGCGPDSDLGRGIRELRQILT